MAGFGEEKLDSSVQSHILHRLHSVSPGVLGRIAMQRIAQPSPAGRVAATPLSSRFAAIAGPSNSLTWRSSRRPKAPLLASLAALGAA